MKIRRRGYVLRYSRKEGEFDRDLGADLVVFESDGRVIVDRSCDD